MALTTHERVKSYLQIKPDDTSKDVVIAEIIERVSKTIATRCNRQFEYQAYTEFHHGDGKFRRLVLDQFPVDSVATFQLYDDYNRAYDSTTLIASTDYSVDYANGIVTLDAFVPFLKGFNNIKVVYSAGYKVIPEDLERAALLMTVAELLDTQSAMQTSIEIETTQRSDRLIKQADDIIKRYRRLPVGQPSGLGSRWP